MQRGVKVAAVAGAAVATWAVGIEPQLFTVRRHDLPLLPAGSKPLRVLQLSDLHLAPWQQNKIEWVKQLAELAPDLVILTGDQTGHKNAIAPLIEALAPVVTESSASFFVHGSNDYYAPRLKNPLKYLQAPNRKATREHDIDNALLTERLTAELGAVNLNNSAANTEVKGVKLQLLGLNDPHIRYDDYEALAASKSVLAADAEAVTLGVVHAPYQEALNFLTDNNCALIFAGHTHGGQLRLPGVGALTSNSDLPPHQARGLSVWYTAENSAFLNVSAGLGASIYAPARFACRPEASLITLTAGN